MKTMKKLFALLLALTMVFGLAATAFADDGGGTEPPAPKGVIKIESPNAKETYNAYRIFDLSLDENNQEAGTAHTYLLRTDKDTIWGTEFLDFKNGTDDNSPKVTDYIKYDSVTGVVTWINNNSENDGTAVKAFAQLIAAYLETKRDTTTHKLPTPDASAKAGDETSGTVAAVEIDNLDLGYWFVTTTTGSVCSLDTSNYEAAIRDKNEPHTDKKTAQEDGTGEYNKTENDASVGDIVNYQVKLTIKPGATNKLEWQEEEEETETEDGGDNTNPAGEADDSEEKKGTLVEVPGFMMHDRMSAGLTPVLNGGEGENKDVIKVEIYTAAKSNDANNNNENNKLEAKNYNVVMVGENDSTCETGKDKCTFHITFTQDYLDSITQATDLYVYYSAVLNEEAVMKAEVDKDNPTNMNESKLTWGDGQFTQWSTVKTDTYEINIFKFAAFLTGDDVDEMLLENRGLAGAEFILYNSQTNNDGKIVIDTDSPVHLVKGTEFEIDDPEDKTQEGGTDGGSGGESSTTPKKVTVDLYTVCAKDGCTGESPDHTHVKDDTIVTRDSGRFNIEGLNAGTYFLKETKAPDGYNLLHYPIKVFICDTETAEEENHDEGAVRGHAYFVRTEKADKDGNPIYEITDSTDGNKVTGSWCGDDENNLGVVNETGTELPSTGGMGTTLFYVVGGLLVLGAAVLLVTKKRTNT